MTYPFVNLSFSVGGIGSATEACGFAVGDRVCIKKKGHSGSGVITEIKGSAHIVELSGGAIVAYDKEELAKELPCPLSGCGRMNEQGVTVCWSCGNKLSA